MNLKLFYIGCRHDYGPITPTGFRIDGFCENIGAETLERSSHWFSFVMYVKIVFTTCVRVISSRATCNKDAYIKYLEFDIAWPASYALTFYGSIPAMDAAIDKTVLHGCTILKPSLHHYFARDLYWVLIRLGVMLLDWAPDDSGGLVLVVRAESRHSARVYVLLYPK